MNLSKRCLVLDIETAPILAHVWGRHDQEIGLNQIKRDWFILAWAAKWLNDPPSKVIYKDSRNKKDVSNDRTLLLPLWRLLDEADIIITQNGKAFDAKKLNARFITHGMNPPSPYQHIDTYKIISNVAAFTSSSLEFLTDKLNDKYKKLKHKKFPGMSLWDGCLANNIEAWNEMRTYNIHDVLSTEELYLNIRAWAPASTPNPYHVKDKSRQCMVCGKSTIEHRGTEKLKSGLFQRLHCNSCGSWPKGDKIK